MIVDVDSNIPSVIRNDGPYLLSVREQRSALWPAVSSGKL